MSNQFINKSSVHMFYKNSNHKFELKTPQTERAALRAEYLQDWRRSTIDVLENTWIVDEKGNKRKLGKK